MSLIEHILSQIQLGVHRCELQVAPTRAQTT
jgi:hypothetical protein